MKLKNKIKNGATKFSFVIIITFIFSYSGFTQDTIRGQVIRVDTVKIEQVRVDTIREYIQQPAPAVASQQKKQQQPKPSAIRKDRIYYGGYANLSFGRYTAIGFEPMIGYKLTPKLSVGGKLSYEYIKDKRYTEDYETSNYGLSVFSRMRVTSRFYAHAEFSTMNYELFYSSGDSKRKWVPFLFLGGGISQPITRNTWLNAEVLFDVLQNDNSPYKAWEPFFSIGFGVGF